MPRQASMVAARLRGGIPPRADTIARTVRSYGTINGRRQEHDQAQGLADAYDQTGGGTQLAPVIVAEGSGAYRWG